MHELCVVFVLGLVWQSLNRSAQTRALHGPVAVACFLVLAWRIKRSPRDRRREMCVCAISGIGCGLRPGRRTPIGNRPETDPGPHTLRVPLYLQLHFQMCRVMRCVACIGGVGSPRYGAARAKTRYSLRIFYSFKNKIWNHAERTAIKNGRRTTLYSLFVDRCWEFL